MDPLKRICIWSLILAKQLIYHGQTAIMDDIASWMILYLHDLVTSLQQNERIPNTHGEAFVEEITAIFRVLEGSVTSGWGDALTFTPYIKEGVSVFPNLITFLKKDILMYADCFCAILDFFSSCIRQHPRAFNEAISFIQQKSIDTLYFLIKALPTQIMTISSSWSVSLKSVFSDLQNLSILFPYSDYLPRFDCITKGNSLLDTIDSLLEFLNICNTHSFLKTTESVLESSVLFDLISSINNLSSNMTLQHDWIRQFGRSQGRLIASIAKYLSRQSNKDKQMNRQAFILSLYAMVLLVPGDEEIALWLFQQILLNPHHIQSILHEGIDEDCIHHVMELLSSGFKTFILPLPQGTVYNILHRIVNSFESSSPTSSELSSLVPRTESFLILLLSLEEDQLGSNILNHIPIEFKLVKIMEIFLLPSYQSQEIFSFPRINELLYSIMNLFSKKGYIKSLDFSSLNHYARFSQSELTDRQNNFFIKFYENFLQQYTFASFGDRVFSQWLLIPLMDTKNSQDLHILFWENMSNTLKSMQLSRFDIPGSLECYLIPSIRHTPMTIKIIAQCLMNPIIYANPTLFLYPFCIYYLSRSLFLSSLSSSSSSFSSSVTTTTSSFESIIPEFKNEIQSVLFDLNKYKESHSDFTAVWEKLSNFSFQ